MAGLPPPAPTSGPEHSRDGTSASRWLSTHRTQALLGGGGLVALYALYRARHASGASSSLLGPAPAGSATTSSGLVPAGYDSTALDQYGTLSSAISQQNDAIASLQQAVTNLGTAPTATAGPTAPSPAPALTPTAGEQLVGSGYGAPGAAPGAPYGNIGGPIDTSSGAFQYVGSPAQAQAIQASGGSLYFQEQPGVFATMPSSGLAPGTPLFSKVA